jgi:hypothetical protein
MENTAENTGLQLSGLKVSNLPELQGWREKQEKLVSDNPYVEVVDSKTYATACQSRTALLKGRTELEKQDKLIASQLAAFRKDVKTETDILIAITLPSEEKQQAEVKRFEEIKALEKAEKERIEKERVDGIKAKIDAIESDCLEIIQSMTFQSVIPDGASVAAICKTDFDFEEYEILYHQVLLRIENATLAKIEDLNESEEQRVAKEKAEEENRLLKEQQELQASRLNELLPYVAFGEAVDLGRLFELDTEAYSEILSSKKALFDADLKTKQEAQEKLEHEKKLKAEKEAIFEIRKSRLAEIGFKFLENQDRFLYEDKNIAISKLLTTIFDADTIDFETIITDAKLDIEKSKSDAEKAEAQKVKDLELSKADALKLQKENKARVNRLANDKKIISESLPTFFAELHLVTENKEIADFIENANVRIQSLKNELLTELEKL